MSIAPLSIILLPTLNCNAACDYCFEQKSDARLTTGALRRITAAILDHMEQILEAGIQLLWQTGQYSYEKARQSVALKGLENKIKVI